jgi:hypothetical protein
MERIAMSDSEAVVYECANFRLGIERPAAGIVVVRLAGSDTGEFGDDPLRELDRDLADDRLIELFVDAREVRAATLDVSRRWSDWLHQNRARFKRVTMLTGSRFIELTADFVRRYAGLEEIMHLHADPAPFDAALKTAIQRATEPPTLADGPWSMPR